MSFNDSFRENFFLLLCANISISLHLREVFEYFSNFLAKCVFQCNLPDVEECMRLAETIQADGDVFETIKYYLLSTEPEKALPVGIQYVKGMYWGEEQF